ncbi:MAG: DMT family transporter [Rhodobacteraceae bacterium]|nr:DMT family transporter [Paracoccaceae bacterium]
MTTQRPLRSALFMIAATSMFAASMLAGKIAQLEGGMHPFQVSHARFLFAFLAIACLVLVLRPRFGKIHWALHTARSTCGFIAATAIFAAAAMIPLADATALSFLSGIFSMVLAIYFLSEKVGPWRWLAAGLSFAGAIVLLRPAGAIELGALIAVAGAAVMGLEMMFIKRLTGLEAPLQMLTINNGIGLAIASVAVVFMWQMPLGSQWLALAGVGLAMVCGQALFIHALRVADASFVAPFNYCVLVFATAYDYAVFAEVPDVISWTGMGIIVSGAALLAWREARASRVAAD